MMWTLLSTKAQKLTLAIAADILIAVLASVATAILIALFGAVRSLSRRHTPDDG